MARLKLLVGLLLLSYAVLLYLSRGTIGYEPIPSWTLGQNAGLMAAIGLVLLVSGLRSTSD